MQPFLFLQLGNMPSKRPVELHKEAPKRRIHTKAPPAPASSSSKGRKCDDPKYHKVKKGVSFGKAKIIKNGKKEKKEKKEKREKREKKGKEDKENKPKARPPAIRKGSDAVARDLSKEFAKEAVGASQKCLQKDLAHKLQFLKGSKTGGAGEDLDADLNALLKSTPKTPSPEEAASDDSSDEVEDEEGGCEMEDESSGDTEGEGGDDDEDDSNDEGSDEQEEDEGSEDEPTPATVSGDLAKVANTTAQATEQVRNSS